MSDLTREEAIDTLEMLRFPEPWEQKLSKRAEEALDMAISALSEREWIPVTERLPENTDDVLVTDGVNMFVAWCIKNNGFWKSYDAKHDEYTPILAWRPLPETYQKGGE